MQKESLTDHAQCAIIALLIWALIMFSLELLKG